MTTAVPGVDAMAINRQVAAEKMLTDMAFRSCPNLVHLECPRLASVALPSRTIDHRDLHLRDHRGPSPSRTLGLKTLKIGVLLRRPWTGGVASVSPGPAMTEVEVVICSKILVYDDSIYSMVPGYELVSEGNFERPQLEQDKKLQWMLNLWPKLTHVVNGN